MLLSKKTESFAGILNSLFFVQGRLICLKGRAPPIMFADILLEKSKWYLMFVGALFLHDHKKYLNSTTACPWVHGSPCVNFQLGYWRHTTLSCGSMSKSKNIHQKQGFMVYSVPNVFENWLL